jgi:hypothetical protein
MLDELIKLRHWVAIDDSIDPHLVASRSNELDQ